MRPNGVAAFLGGPRVRRRRLGVLPGGDDAWRAADGPGFGLLALAIGGATGERGLVIGITVAAPYLLSSLAPVVDGLKPWWVLPLFYWSVGDGQLTTGLGWDGLVVLVAAVLIGLVAAIAAFDRTTSGPDLKVNRGQPQYGWQREEQGRRLPRPWDPSCVSRGRMTRRGSGLRLSSRGWCSGASSRRCVRLVGR